MKKEDLQKFESIGKTLLYEVAKRSKLKNGGIESIGKRDVSTKLEKDGGVTVSEKSVYGKFYGKVLFEDIRVKDGNSKSHIVSVPSGKTILSSKYDSNGTDEDLEKSFSIEVQNEDTSTKEFNSRTQLGITSSFGFSAYGVDTNVELSLEQEFGYSNTNEKRTSTTQTEEISYTIPPHTKIKVLSVSAKEKITETIDLSGTMDYKVTVIIYTKEKKYNWKSASHKTYHHVKHKSEFLDTEQLKGILNGEYYSTGTKIFQERPCSKSWIKRNIKDIIISHQTKLNYVVARASGTEYIGTPIK